MSSMTPRAADTRALHWRSAAASSLAHSVVAAATFRVLSVLALSILFQDMNVMGQPVLEHPLGDEACMAPPNAEQVLQCSLSIF